MQILTHIFNPTIENPLIHDEYLIKHIKTQLKDNIPDHPCGKYILY